MTISQDGVIKQGIASIDQPRLTGETQPAEKTIGDSVFASTLVLSGKLYVQVEKTGQETVAVQIGKILSEMSNFTLCQHGNKTFFSGRSGYLIERSEMNPTI